MSEDIEFQVDYVEIYCSMAKLLAHFHVSVLGFEKVAFSSSSMSGEQIESILIQSGGIRLLLTSTFSTEKSPGDAEVIRFVSKNQLGVRRIVVSCRSVEEAFRRCVAGGGIPLQSPTTITDTQGVISRASFVLFDDNEIVFLDRSRYQGVFLPGFSPATNSFVSEDTYFDRLDHIASEVRFNSAEYWTKYLNMSLGLSTVQSIQRGVANKSGLVLNVNQSKDAQVTFVVAEPESIAAPSKVQNNINLYGPGIHHLAFHTSDIVSTARKLLCSGVEFVSFPKSYYDIIRESREFDEFDIDLFEELNILIDREENSFLLQKFIKPIGDRPFFIYEIVQRINEYSGFALKNINVLKRAEETEIMK